MPQHNAYAKHLFCNFDGIDRDNRIVSGIFTDDLVDMQGHLIERDGMERAISEYRQWGNVREMHDKPVGVAASVGSGEDGDDGWNRISARIVSDSAWDLVDGGVYRGFSIGAIVHDGDVVPVESIPSEKFAGLDEVIRSSIEEFGYVFVVTKLSLIEVSIVDRPANPRAVFTNKGLGSGDVMALPGFADDGFGAIEGALHKDFGSVAGVVSSKKEKMMDDIQVESVAEDAAADPVEVEVVDVDVPAVDEVVEVDNSDDLEGNDGGDADVDEVELSLEPDVSDDDSAVDLEEIVDEMTKRVDVLVDAISLVSKRLDALIASEDSDDRVDALVEKIVSALEDRQVVRKSAVYSADEEYDDAAEPMDLKSLGRDELLGMIVRGVAVRAK